ncbi:disease resistance protein RPV1-like [Corylus avellana]|uniref:disease resistance protein RPV1-like n=1 Tax=Corylus avellana TaxID=13451 RepID=UPI00286CFEE7|nr:disease resistance protein RPV1-like [Corylus avellana]
MDRRESQTAIARPSLKRKLEPESQDRNQARKILVVEDPNKDVQSNSTSTSTSSFSRPHWNYDVFLSFRGEDTRKNFTDHLYSALLRVGIHTFRDDEELRRGKTISTELLNAIRGSRISIVVFSKGYASSRWCLDELVEIVQCRNTIGHTLLPIFYHVDPSDVRKQAGTFAEAFAGHEERFQTDIGRVQRWRVALTEAANCSGWNLESLENGYESSFIEKIVEHVSYELEPIGLNVARHPTGINYRVNRVKDLLNLGISDIRIVGLYGMGGIGKTTIAKAVYNQICYGFEGSSCLLNIKEISEQPNGLVRLQEQLLYDILKMRNLKIDNVDRGINLIKKRIHGKRVLVVLDDVDDMEQLHALVGNSEWFGPGSRVIATTRDEHILTKLGVHGKYKVEELGEEESLQLFNLNAFNMSHPKEDYLELSIGAVKYCGGLPLALEVLGSFLLGRNVDEWKSELEKLQKIPHHQIQEILRISLKSLDDSIKDIFLDIACFFVGMDKEYVIKILDGCGSFPVIGINILAQRSLVAIDCKNKLRMHDLIRDMRREIIREKSPNLPGKRSRLWLREDVLNVLLKHTGSETVEALILSLSVLEYVNLKTEAFTNMKNLRLLQINAVHLTGSYEHLSKELRWLCWHNCPLEFLPQNFHLENLVILDMQHSNVKQVWEKKKILNKLKVLNLSNSKYLTKSPDFSQVPQLEILIFEGCISLVQVHESIGNLKRLVLLNLEGCKNLRNLPKSISNLKSLETLNLSGCLKLDKLPEELGNMMALTQLLADGTAIKQLPSSFVFLKNLKTLLLSGCKEQSSKSWFSLLSSWMSPQSLNPISLLPASISGLRSLTTLDLPDRNLSEDGIPADLGSLSSLRNLDLSRNNFHNLPDCISNLPKLYFLWLGECTTLQSISGLPPSVGVLDASGCTSVERLSILPNHKSSQFFNLRNCHKLIEIQGLENLEFTSIIHTEGCNKLAYDFRSHLQCSSSMRDDQYRVICLPGSEVPNWFSHQRIGSSISFHVPSISNGQILRLLVCAVYSANSEYNKMGGLDPHVIINNKTRGYDHTLWPTLFPGPVTCEDHVFLYQTPLISNEIEMESGDEIELSIKLRKAAKVKKCGIHLLVDEPNVMEEYGSMVHYFDSDTAKDDAGHGEKVSEEKD